MPPPPAPGTANIPPQPTGNAPDFSLSFGKTTANNPTATAAPPRGVSAPTSPAKSRESLLQRVQSLTGAARDQGASILGAAVQSATRAPAFNKDKYFTLLVLDDHNTDWSKYFRGKRLHGDYDIRVEQAEFRDITLHASAESGPVVTMEVHRGDSRIPRMFRPDFVLIRQPPRDGANDYRSTILGLKYGGVPSINSLHSIYQFQDKPWVFAHLQQLQRRLGKENFPLIEQTFFPSPKYLLNWTKFPCVLKAGHCHGGMATARFDNQMGLQDAAGLVSGTGFEGHCYCTIEPYIDAKFDVHIQKIGSNYKAFMRKSITGNWKTNQGSAMLEQITLTEKYKTWVDEISELFGGMEVCGVSVVVGKDGREHIIKASDSTFALMGDSQEDDRRQIADLVTSRMQNVCRPGMNQQQSVGGHHSKLPSVSSRGQSPTDEIGHPPTAPTGPRPAPMGGPPPIPERTSPAVGSIGRLSSRSSISEVPEEAPPSAGSVPRRDSQTSQASSISSASRTQQRPPQTQTSVVEDAEDTMKNLRKTFAGIFGDISFLGKQFSFASGKTSASTSSGLGDSVISAQPQPKTSEGAADARSDTSSTSTLTAGSVSSSSKPASSVLDESKYKPVTNFEPQERVNPFDKGAVKASTTTATLASTSSTTSSSSISASSISSRINVRTDSNFKSPPPPSRPPPPPPQQAASVATNSSHTYHSSTASNKDKSSYIYGSSTSIETITRMDTTNTASNSNPTATTSLGQSSQNTGNTKIRNITDTTTGGMGGVLNNTTAAAGNEWTTGRSTAASVLGTRSASVYSAPAVVSTAPAATEDAQSTAAASNGYNAATDMPSYTRPSYSRSENNGSQSKVSDLDIIFGDSSNMPPYTGVGGGGKFSRSGGSLSDAELIFGTSSSTASYKTDRFGSSKSMSVTSDRHSSGGGGGPAPYKIYEGIQNAGFSDYGDAKKSMGSTSSVNTSSYSSWRNTKNQDTDDDDLDLK